MDREVLNRSTQSFSYSLLLHGLLLLVLVYGLPGFLHKPVQPGARVMAIDIMVVAPVQFNILPQPIIAPKAEVEIPRKIDAILPVKTQIRMNAPPKENKSVSGEANEQASTALQMQNNALSAQEAALEEKRKKEKLKEQSLIFANGHALPALRPVSASSIAIQNGVSTPPGGNVDYSWR